MRGWSLSLASRDPYHTHTLPRTAPPNPGAESRRLPLRSMRDERPLPFPTFSFPLVALALLFGLFLTGCDEAVIDPTLRGS